MANCLTCKNSVKTLQCRSAKCGMHLDNCPFYDGQRQTRFESLMSDKNLLARRLVHPVPVEQWPFGTKYLFDGNAYSSEEEAVQEALAWLDETITPDSTSANLGILGVTE